MRRISVLLAPLVAAAAVAACSSSDGMTPGSPSPPSSAAVTSVAVSSAPSSASTFQMTAIARFADGTTRDVTTAASWSSSNPAVVSVSDTGVAVVRGTGTVELRATYQNVAGATTIDVTPAFALSGHIQEAEPASTAISGVRVEIVRGSAAGTSVTSDASGAFHFDRLSGLVDIEASKPGYMPWRLSNLTVDHDTSLDVSLYPTPPVDGSGHSATARCADGAWSWAQTVAEACADDGGILYGVCPGVLCAATRSIR